MIRKLLFAIVLLASITARATDYTICSPDGRLIVTISDEGGKASYKASFDGYDVITPSLLGINANYADFTQVGFTEFCSNYVAKEKKIMYQIPENHKPNLEFVEDMVHEMKKFPKEFSSQIFKSIFHYNINQLEMQFSSFAPSTHFFVFF